MQVFLRTIEGISRPNIKNHLIIPLNIVDKSVKKLTWQLHQNKENHVNNKQPTITQTKHFKGLNPPRNSPKN